MYDFLTALKLTNKEVIYKELKLKQYKNLLKCLYADPIDASNLLLNLNNILKQLTNLTEQEILNLNLLEYLTLLIDIRVTSIGNSIFAVYNAENESVNIDIPLNNTLNEIKKCLNEFKTFTYKDSITEITFDIPTVNNFLNKEFFYIKEDENYIKQLPVKYLKIINKNFKKFNSYIEQYYFFNPGIKKYSIKFSLDKINYIQLIKILFNENLISIYDNIFYLSKICNISSDYLENCTYGEFKIFVKKTEEMIQKQIKQPVNNTEDSGYEPVDINSLYGNDESLNITPSEFTP